MAPHGCYPCGGDDQWVTIACEHDTQFAALCAAMGQPELTADGRFADVVTRHRNQDALDKLISDWTRQRTKEAVSEALQAVGVPCSPVLSVPEVFTDPHMLSCGFYESVSHAVAGVWDVEGPHWHLSESPGHIRLPAPAFAEHNSYVLGELLGLSAEKIAELEREGVTGPTPDWTVRG
jgi:crotonobetainyl-CoA:carnitine CoA-transferase CaiB-like acyl-CoA transferase